MTNHLIKKVEKIYADKPVEKIPRHKFALILSLLNIYEKFEDRGNKFYFDPNLEDHFKYWLKVLQPEIKIYDGILELPFYFLQSDGFWHLKIREGFENIYDFYRTKKKSRFTKNRIIETYEYGYFSPNFYNYITQQENREALRNSILNRFHRTPSPTRVSRPMQTDTTTYTDNPFVGYLNSLQRIGGGNENALAEAQACNPQFSKIRQPHPLADTVHQYLKQANGGHVVLTGHAGDGKTTLALEVYKQLQGLEADAPLKAGMPPRVDVGDISIIKDLSERDHAEDDSFVTELLSGKRRFLLVSNTGTLLSILKENSAQLGKSEIELETAVLEEISNKEGGGELKLDEVSFQLLNLAQIDNLSLAKGIFERMLSKENWQPCNDCDYCPTCPIYLNVGLLFEHRERVVERIFLLYRRLYEYGSRLTIRQLTEHMGYCLSCGHDCKDVREKKLSPHSLSFSLLNRFFGDDGCNPDLQAQSLRAIIELKKQKLGQNYSNAWERELWVKKTNFTFIGSFQDTFDNLHRLGAASPNPSKLSPPAARQQARRALYFLYDFSQNSPQVTASKYQFMESFLDSSYLLTWLDWQQKSSLELHEEQRLKKGLFQVLQEHFAGGVRLPEGYHTPERLYITMANPEKRMRQASQIVTTELDWQQGFTFQLVKQQQINNNLRFDLQLHGITDLSGVNLLLSVPFLDFMAMRQRGEVGEGLDRSYIRRLDHLKTRLEKQKGRDQERLLLVHIQNDGSFSRQNFQLSEDGSRLEVTND